MKAYLLRRVMQAIPTLLFIGIVTFSIAMLLPGDPARAMLGENLVEIGLDNDATQQHLQGPLGGIIDVEDAPEELVPVRDGIKQPAGRDAGRGRANTPG
jgi:ABC-type microcin C transport system permease subunit YejB